MALLTQAELVVLNSDMRMFPMIAAASAALRRCGTCGHKNANIAAMLNTAVTLYHNKPEFKQRIKELVGLPVTIGRYRIEE